MRLPCRLVLFASALAILLPKGGWAADPGSRSPTTQGAAAESPARLFGLGTQEVGMVVGYGFPIRIGGTRDEELREIQYIYAAPQWGIGITHPIGGDSWWRGNFELVLEGTFIGNFEPKGGVAVGLTGLIRYNFLPDWKVIPFLEVGGGLLYVDMDFKERSDGLNFAPQAGLGLRYFISDRTAITGEWRFHHISNADTKLPNFGINSSLFLIGISIVLK